MGEVWDIVRYFVLGIVCRLIGHPWMTLPDGDARVCLRCLTYQSGF